jgi:hypothetical protein
MKSRRLLIASLLTFALLGATSTAATPAQPQVTEPVAWAVVGSGEDPFNLEVPYSLGLGYRSSGCGFVGTQSLKVRETKRSIHITLTRTYTPSVPTRPEPAIISCPAPSLAVVQVALKAPVAGRRIYGRSTAAITDDLKFGEDGAVTKVPPLLGLAPIDAQRALAVRLLSAGTARIRPGRGLPRVIGERPRAGSDVPPGTVVRLLVKR